MLLPRLIRPARPRRLLLLPPAQAGFQRLVEAAVMADATEAARGSPGPPKPAAGDGNASPRSSAQPALPAAAAPSLPVGMPGMVGAGFMGNPMAGMMVRPLQIPRLLFSACCSRRNSWPAHCGADISPLQARSMLQCQAAAPA